VCRAPRGGWIRHDAKNLLCRHDGSIGLCGRHVNKRVVISLKLQHVSCLVFYLATYGVKYVVDGNLSERKSGRAPINLETAVGRARVGCDGVRWQGATTLRAPARKEKQRRRRAPARLNRVRSVVTLEVTLPVSTKARVHNAYPAEESGQLRFLG